MKHSNEQEYFVGDEVREINGNSLSPKYKVIDVNWYETTDSFQRRSQWKYTTAEVGSPDNVAFFFGYEIKSAFTLCPYEAYGDKMVGKVVKEVFFNQNQLIIDFEDGYKAEFEACGGEYSSLEFPQSN